MDIKKLNYDIRRLFGFDLEDLAESYDEVSDSEKQEVHEIFENLINAGLKEIEDKNLPEDFFKHNRIEASNLLIQVIPKKHLDAPFSFFIA